WPTAIKPASLKTQLDSSEPFLEKTLDTMIYKT
ncbi:unnamed protein product, partial [marine sediment metagenome]